MSRRVKTSAPVPAASPALARSKDIVLIHGPTEDGEGLRVLRVRPDRLETGAVRPLKSGQAVHGEIMTLHPRPDCPVICDVEQHVSAPVATDVLVRSSEAKPTESASAEERPSAGHKGPAQVATDRYRANWDSIWKRADGKKHLLN